jgi:hypothetical protein
LPPRCGDDGGDTDLVSQIPATGPCARVLVAGEFRDTSPWAVILALDGLAAPCTTLTVAVVAEYPGLTGLLLSYAPVPADEVRRELVREAGLRACRLADLAPPDVRVEHLVTDGWRGLVRHVAERRYDAVVVGEAPSRWRDRRLVRRAGWPVASLDRQGVPAKSPRDAPLRTADPI